MILGCKWFFVRIEIRRYPKGDDSVPYATGPVIDRGFKVSVDPSVPRGEIRVGPMPSPDQMVGGKWVRSRWETPRFDHVKPDYPKVVDELMRNPVPTDPFMVERPSGRRPLPSDASLKGKPSVG